MKGKWGGSGRLREQRKERSEEVKERRKGREEERKGE